LVNGDSTNSRAMRRFRLGNAVIRSLQPAFELFGPFARKELLYQHLFYQAAAANGLVLPALYPVQSAANYSLLYAILRAVSELPVRSILDVGAGQSTLLLNELSRCNPHLSIDTLETNPTWAARIQSKVRHRVHCVELARRRVRDRETTAYADLSVLGDQRYDLVVVDGPPGSKRYSRWGALEVLERSLGDDYLVIFDDAGRRGEEQTISDFMRRSPKQVGCHTLRSMKSQFLTFTPLFGAAAYF
jgi:predicted O-methyltransferase YrrM